MPFMLFFSDSGVSMMVADALDLFGAMASATIMMT